MARTFSCYTPHMEASMPDGWQRPHRDQRKIVADFFALVVKKRTSKEFYIHGEDRGYGSWKDGEKIEFHVQGGKTACARATFRAYVALPHTGGCGHFLLDDICILYVPRVAAGGAPTP